MLYTVDGKTAFAAVKSDVTANKGEMQKCNTDVS